MNRRQKRPQPLVRNPAFRRALERLEAALECNGDGSNAEKIERLGRLMFGDTWDDEHSETPPIPE